MIKDNELNCNIKLYGSPISGPIKVKLGNFIDIKEINKKQSITVKQVESCFEEAMKMVNSNLYIDNAIHNVVKNTGMNRGSASIYIWAINNMYKGRRYEKGISIMGLQVIIKKMKELNNDNLIRNLIKSFKEHVKYAQQFYINEVSQKEIISFENEEIQGLSNYLLHR